MQAKSTRVVFLFSKPISRWTVNGRISTGNLLPTFLSLPPENYGQIGHQYQVPFGPGPTDPFAPSPRRRFFYFCCWLTTDYALFFHLDIRVVFFPALLFPSSCPAGGDFLLFRQLQLDRNCNCNCNPRIFLHSIRNLFHLITIRHIKRSVSRVCTPVPFCFAFAFDTCPTPGRYLGLVAPLPLSHHLSSRTPYPLHAQEKATRSASLGRKSPRSAQSPDDLSCPHLSPSSDVRLTHSASHIPLLSSLYQHTDAHRVLLKTTQRLYLLLDTRFCIP